MDLIGFGREETLTRAVRISGSQGGTSYGVASTNDFKLKTVACKALSFEAFSRPEQCQDSLALQFYRLSQTDLAVLASLWVIQKETSNSFQWASKIVQHTIVWHLTWSLVHSATLQFIKIHGLTSLEAFAVTQSVVQLYVDWVLKWSSLCRVHSCDNSVISG